MGDINFTGSPLAVAVTAAVFSPRVRQVLHRGAVHGLAGVLIAGDAVTSFARGVGRGLQEASTAAPGQDTAEQPAASATQAAQAATRAAEEATRAAQDAARAAQMATEAAQKAAAEPKAAKARKTATRAKASPKTGGSES
jgi:ABC-type branched-subunit amino acid transport system substrate-binding protein